MTYPAVFSAEAVDRIVEAVKKLAAVPADLDRKQLGLDLDRAIFWYLDFKALSRSQPWGEYRKRGKELVKAGQAFPDLWAKDDAVGRWWREQLEPYADLAKATEVTENVKDLIRKLMAERITSLPESRWKKQRPMMRPARWVLEPDGPESATEWLVGEHLATVFERHFHRPAAARRYQSSRKGGEVVPGKVSAYVAFALAVSESGGIRNRDGSLLKAETVITYRKKMKKKKKLD